MRQERGANADMAFEKPKGKTQFTRSQRPTDLVGVSSKGGLDELLIFRIASDGLPVLVGTFVPSN